LAFNLFEFIPSKEYISEKNKENIVNRNQIIVFNRNQKIVSAKYFALGPVKSYLYAA